jgi:excinuclease UvrABC ATPase subunit
MAKLKVNQLKKVICHNCKGNGFLKIIFDTNDTNIFQCWVCDSEGELYEKNDTNYIGDNSINKLH